MLRFKGFSKDNYETIPDYLMESCTPNAPYFVLKRIMYRYFIFFIVLLNILGI